MNISLMNFVRHFLKNGKKKKVLLDTNILFSHIFFHSKHTEILFDIIHENFELCLCDYIIQELKDVANRKMPDKVQYINSFLNEIPFNLISYNDDLSKTPNMRDPKDRPILATAIQSNIDYLITGDKDFLTLSLSKPKILRITEFIELFIKGE